jgi:type IV pilus assembly protein PilY1
MPTVGISDDTEIYFDINQVTDNEAYNPNVLFILDTSGSMTSTMTTVDFGTDTYDSTQTYGSSPVTTVYGYTEDLSSFVALPRTQVSCQAMLTYLDNAANITTPIYTGKTAGYSTNGGPWWLDINWWPRGWGEILECEEDEANHGQTDATNPYTVVTGGIITSSVGSYYTASATNSGYGNSAGSTVDWSQMSTRKFVTANYHDFIQAHSTSDTRTNVMKTAAKSLVDNFSDMNIGLMRFDGNDGGYVVHHFSDIDTDGANIKTKIDALTASGNTPLTETLWEAHRYFKGLSVDWGDKSTSAAVSSSDHYNSPIDDSADSDVAVDCQSNYVVYLTDGQPTQDSNSDSNINTLVDPGDTVTDCSHTGGTTADSTCLDEMSKYMAEEADYNDKLTGKQTVQTYTIAFGLDLPLLQAAATANDDNGGYYTANNSTELNNAFDKILTNIEQTSTTFVAPAVSVNAFNSLQNRNEIYYALFEPNLYPRWYGNVKKYKINTNGAILGQGMAIDVEKDADAIDDATGYFDEGALSFWSDQSTFPPGHPLGQGDGYQVKLGGAAGELGTTRTVYTIANDSEALRKNSVDLNSKIEYLISQTNPANDTLPFGIDKTQTTLEIDTDLKDVINWILGEDVKDLDEDLDVTEASRFMSDPLHSRPVVVAYGGTEADPESTLFSTDNGGAFRAINTKNGEELFAFIPPELLKNQKIYLDNDASNVTDKGKSKFVYGLDGPMTIWRKESTDPDIIIETGDQDHVYAYFGMRRGGSNYYAMDVTDTDDPQLMWTIFGPDAAYPNPDFSDLGQTWSQPKLQKVLWGCGTSCDPETNPSHLKDVLFFAGGYDPIHDPVYNIDDTITLPTPTTGDRGAAIYMVDAKTGALLWSAGKSGHNLNLNGSGTGTMENSIPGDLTVADINGDGAADIIFAIDIQGHVWRFDIDSKNTSASNFATGGEIADLSDTSSASTFRRFYVGPTVSLSQKRGRAPFFVITVGSGYVAHPLNTVVNNRMYALFEKNVYAPHKDSSDNNIYVKIDTTQLVDMTNSASGPADPATDTGFYKDAEVVDSSDSRGPGSANGEKFLRRALTQQGITIYTSYIPSGSPVATDNEACGSAQLGRSRIFAIDFVTGASVYEGEYIDLQHPGISSDPVIIILENEDTDDDSVEQVLCVDTECFNTEEEENPYGEVTTQILYWRENAQ